MGKKNSNRGGGGSITIHKPATQSEFNKLHNQLMSKRYIPVDLLKPGKVRDISLAVGDAANAGAQEMSASMGCGSWSNGPLSRVAWSFDGHDNTTEHVYDIDGNDLGDYVKWGAGDNIPSVIPPLAMSSPYTAAPLRYIADLTTGLGVRLMFRMPDGDLVEYKDAGELLQQQIDKLEKTEDASDTTEQQLLEEGLVAVGQEPRKKESKVLKRLKDMYADWERSWYGFDVEDEIMGKTHVPGAKEFLEENNLDLHMSQCMQDNVMLDIYFPTVGLQRGRAKLWDYPTKPRIIRCDVLPAHSTRLGTMDSNRYIHDVFFSDSLRRKGSTGNTVTVGSADQDNSFKKYPCAMPQHMLSEINYLVESNRKTRIKARPLWIVCPTFYPSLQKPYYPQPAWWSVFTSKAFDFSATVLYDKYKQRDNNTTWSKILYISLDYLNLVYSDLGIEGDKEAQEKFIEDLDNNMEQFLQQRENNGKLMRQFMWQGQGDKTFKNVEIVDVKETTSDGVKAGKEELELSTSPIFLALQVDPRLVGVPMVAASNGGTALREMHLLKQQQLSIHKRNYERFMNAIATYNEWSRAEFHVVDQTLTTLDNSKTGTVEVISSEGA